MDTDKTRTELVLEAAYRLQVVGTGQSLEAEYSDRIDSNVDPMIQQLASDGICNVVDDQHIPAEWFNALAGLLANASAAVAGKAADAGTQGFYEAQLKRVTSSRPSYAVQEAEYF